MSQASPNQQITQQKLMRQLGEVQGASARIHEFLIEIEVMMHRISVASPDVVAANKELAQFLSDWQTARVTLWERSLTFSMQQNWLGA